MRLFESLVPFLCCLAACASAPNAAPVSRATASRPAAAKPPPRKAREAEGPGELYAADEALRDVLSGPWEYVDTGPWPGNNRTQACVFKNDRVIMVNAYCTLSEVPASRIDVYSPQRGRVRIYAEANGPVSDRERSEYFTFMVESEPPPGPQTNVPPLSLDMSFDELYAYEKRRYEAYLPACYGGEQRSQHAQRCMGDLGPHTDRWAQDHQDFLQAPGAAWYHVVRKARSLAQHYGVAIQ